MVFNVPLYGPHWFNGVDTAFEIVSIIAAMMVWWYARKIKCITGDSTCCALGQAFLLIAVSFTVKVLTNIAVYLEIDKLGDIAFFSQVIGIQVMFALGYFLYRLFFLVALIWLVCIGLKIMDWRVRLLFVLFAAIATFFSHYSYVVFHLIALVLLMYVVADKYANYRGSQNRRSAVIGMSFFLILLSQLMFLFVGLEQWTYVVGETLQLLGFIGIIYNQFTLPKAKCCFASSVQPRAGSHGKGAERTHRGI